MRIYSSNYYFDELDSESERSAYYSISAAVGSRSESCTVYSSDAEAVNRAWRAYVLDNPGMFHYPGLFASLSSNGYMTILDIKYSDCDAELCRMRMNEVVGLIRRSCPDGTGAYKTCKTIYEYLTKNIKYDHDVFAEYLDVAALPVNTDGEREERRQREIEMLRERSNAFSPVGVFVDKRAVCMGLSKAFKLLCEQFGIPCICVEAKARGDQPYDHMLNIVEIDGVCSVVDTTKGIMPDDFRMHQYDLFLATIKTAELFYTFNQEFECNTEKNSYHSRRRIVFSNLNDLRSYISGFDAAAQRYELRFRYTGGLLSDSELWEFTEKVIRPKLYRGATFGGFVSNGFVNAMINKN